MSTKSTWGYARTTEKKMFHIYYEGLDGRYYFETHDERIELPEKLAKEFAKILDKFDKDINQEKSE